MKKTTILFLFIPFLYSCGVQKAIQQDIDISVPIEIYDTTTDFVNKTPLNISAKAVITNESNQHIKIKTIIENGYVIKNWKYFWAIKYKNNIYFNTLYSKDMGGATLFVKLDLQGDICSIILDKNTPKAISVEDHLKSAAYSTGGLVGASLLLTVSSPQYKWKDKHGNEKIIVLIETKFLAPAFGKRKPGAFAYLLNRRNFKALINEYHIQTKKKIKELKFEDVMHIVDLLNEK